MATAKAVTKNRERLLAFAIVVSLLAGWVVGWSRHHSDVAGFLQQGLPDAVRFESEQDDIYAGLTDAQSESETVGYVAIRSAPGYAGPVTVAVGLDPNGTVVNAVLVRQTESPAFFRKVADKGFPGRFKGKACSDPFEIGDDVDSVTGATVTLTALTEAIRLACSDIATGRLGLPPVVRPRPPIQFGLPEILLILLIATGFAAHAKKLPGGPTIRWVVLIASLVFVGFVWRRPVSLANINSLLIGYWPGWQNGVYWCVLLAALLVPAILTGKTPYCSHICPFGAAQEILVKVGGSKRQLPPKYGRLFKILQRALAWIAVMCALIFRNPTAISYEAPATLFTFIGANWQFVLLALILIASLFIARPWCNALCPIRAVTDYLRLLRRNFGR